ncbi:MAG: dynamin family protein [Fibromonadales bacterium]|nr:dynamin family protein [Fibromonadales bacterium]
MNAKYAKDRIIIDYSSVRSEIENIICEINSLCSDRLFIKVLGANQVQRIKNNSALIKKRIDEKFNIVVIGEFKRGKSSLINAIIGENVLPTAVTPETVTINKVSYLETPKVEAVLKNGKKAMLSYNELKRESIEKIAKELPADIDFIDIMTNLEILKDISIVDTPGLGDLLKAFDQKVVEYLTNADALIYLASARVPFSMTERMFLSAVVMPQSFSRIFAVLNMADILETAEDIEMITNFTRERISAISPDISMFVLSSLDELCRRKGLKRPVPELESLLENNFLEFENALKNDIILQKDIIKSTRMVNLTQFMIGDIINRIMIVKNTLRSNINSLISSEENLRDKNGTLQKSIDDEKTEIANAIDEMRREAKDWMSEFMLRLKNEIGSIGVMTSVDDIEKNFQFFLSDHIKNAIMICVEKHQECISDKMSNITKKVSSKIAPNMFIGVDTVIVDIIPDISWTSADTISFYGSIVAPSAGTNLLRPFVLLGQIIVGFMKDSEKSKKQADFITPFLDGFASISQKVIASLDSIYEKLKLTSIDKLRDSFQSQIDMSLEAISNAKQIASDESVKSEEVIEYLDSVLLNLEGYKKTLEEYKNVKV